MKPRSNARKRFLVDGGILYRRAGKFYTFRRRAVDAGEVFDPIQEHQTNSTHSGKIKIFTALNLQFFSIKRQEVAFLLKHCRTCAQKKPQTRTTRAPLKPIKVHNVPGGVVGWNRKPDAVRPRTQRHNYFDISTTVQLIAAKLKSKGQHIINKKPKCHNTQKSESLIGQIP